MPRNTPKPEALKGVLNEAPPKILDVYAGTPADQMAADMQKDALNRGEDPTGAEVLS